jgi:hypothetical protein
LRRSRLSQEICPVCASRKESRMTFILWILFVVANPTPQLVRHGRPPEPPRCAHLGVCRIDPPVQK